MSELEEAKRLFFEASAFIDASDFHNAELRLRDALGFSPGSVSVLTNLAVVLLRQSKRIEAREFAEKAISAGANNIEALLVLADCQAGDDKFVEALALYDRIISLDRAVPEAYNNQGFILAKLKRPLAALDNFDLAIAADSKFIDAYINRGNTLQDLKRYDDAFTAYDKALSLKPDLAKAWLGRGNVFNALKRYDEALAAYDKALGLKPDLEGAWLGRGNVFFNLKRYDDAFAAYDKALAINPDLENAWLACGNAFSTLRRCDEALAAYDKALALKPDLEGAWLGRGNVLSYLKRHDDASAAYDKALSLNSDLAEAWLGRGNVFFDLRRHDDASAAYDKALSLKPDLAEAWLGRGKVFFDLRRHDDASAAYDKALSLNSDLAEAWLARGNTFYELKHYDEAFAAYDKALAIKPDLEGAEASRLNLKMYLGDWSNFDNESWHLTSAVRNGEVNASPFPLLAISSSPEDQLQCAKLWVAKKYPAHQMLLWRAEPYRHDRIRLAYLSADFRLHPVSSLIAGVIECHDKSRFDVTALSLGPDDGSEMRERLKASFEHFIEVGTYSDDRLVELVKRMEIDILVDLMGFTKESRIRVFAERSAPIQVNFLGYLATMGVEYMDYIIADKIVIPETQRDFYAEKIVYLPYSFQPTDRERRISKKEFTRTEAGLPQEGFVFCCFNTNYKITPDVFDIWIRILKRVDGSVLWLVANNSTFERNIRKEAAARGINAERLVFSPIVPLSEYQARLRLADLFLDTLPYNAGATASDMLWAGLPVLTRLGDTFVGRMAASVLNAIDLPELITTTSEAYEQMAVDLATHPEKLTTIRRKLAEHRLTTPLFDTRLFAKHIEAAYTAMYERYQAGLTPDHIVIPN
jgi:predicted O-linked N-acetylglucosamine transferase (SPINDLY family)